MGETRFADTEGRPPSGPPWPSGETGLNWIRARTRARDGGVAASATRAAPPPPRWLCFSLARRARSGVPSAVGAAAADLVRGTGFGVLGSRLVTPALSATATMSRANWLACTISRTVSPSSIAGSDIRAHCAPSPRTAPPNLPFGDRFCADAPPLILHAVG